MPGHTSFGTRGSQVQILPLRPNKSRKIGRFLQRPESSPHLPGLLSGPKLGAAMSTSLDRNHRRATALLAGAPEGHMAQFTD